MRGTLVDGSSGKTRARDLGARPLDRFLHAGPPQHRGRCARAGHRERRLCDNRNHRSRASQQQRRPAHHLAALINLVRHARTSMPSFDIVSELNAHEVANAIDQANREVGTRFDFKGTDAKYELKDYVVTLSAQADFQLKQMMDILKLKLTKRGIDIVCMKVDEPVITGTTAKQVVNAASGNRYRARQEAAAPDQGFEAQGAGGDPGQAGARDRQEPRRSAGSDRDGARRASSSCRCSSRISGTEATVTAYRRRTPAIPCRRSVVRRA